MKNQPVTLMALIGILIAPCQKNTQLTPQQTIAEVSSFKTKKSAKDLVFNNKYLDLDINKLSKEKNHSDGDKITAKAILYRFYKHVHLVNGYYTLDIKQAKDINISNPVYLALLNNLNEVNDSVKEARSKGRKVETPEVDDNYLNSLLK